MEGQQLRIVTFAPDAQDAEDIEATGSIVWNYYKTDGVQSMRGSAKNVKCMFCDAAFSGCSSCNDFELSHMSLVELFSLEKSKL